MKMDFCTNYLNYSELMSTAVFHCKWNRTSLSSFAEQKILNSFENDGDSVINSVWMIANWKYIFSLPILMAILFHFKLVVLKQQDQQHTYSFVEYISMVKLYHWDQCDISAIFFTLSCFIAFMMLLPILVVAWLFVLSYRQYIYFIIRVSCKHEHLS